MPYFSSNVNLFIIFLLDKLIFNISRPKTSKACALKEIFSILKGIYTFPPELFMQKATWIKVSHIGTVSATLKSHTIA